MAKSTKKKAPVKKAPKSRPEPAKPKSRMLKAIEADEAKAKAEQEAKDLRRRGRQTSHPAIQKDGNIEELNLAVIDAYNKTDAWKAALKPMVDAKKKVQDLLHQHDLQVYTADDPAGSTAELVVTKEKVALSRQNRDPEGDDDLPDDGA
jgi:hypothetical protein